MAHLPIDGQILNGYSERYCNDVAAVQWPHRPPVAVKGTEVAPELVNFTVKFI